MESTMTSSTQTSTKESKITPYNPDYILALCDRAILFASPDLRPDNFSELEKALATDGKKDFENSSVSGHSLCQNDLGAVTFHDWGSSVSVRVEYCQRIWLTLAKIGINKFQSAKLLVKSSTSTRARHQITK